MGVVGVEEEVGVVLSWYAPPNGYLYHFHCCWFQGVNIFDRGYQVARGRGLLLSSWLAPQTLAVPPNQRRKEQIDK